MGVAMWSVVGAAVMGVAMWSVVGAAVMGVVSPCTVVFLSENIVGSVLLIVSIFWVPVSLIIHAVVSCTTHTHTHMQMCTHVLACMHTSTLII